MKVVILPGPVIREVTVDDGKATFGAELSAVPEGAEIGYVDDTRLSDVLAAGCTVSFEPRKEKQ